MDDVEKILLLQRDCGFNENTAKAYISSGGKCTYCGIDLITNRLYYASSQIDHLLPKAKYKSLKNTQENNVLCCTLCNSLKSKIDPIKKQEDPKIMLTRSKEVLIERIKTKIEPGREEANKYWLKVKEIMRS